MATDDLRKLAAEATPGKWAIFRDLGVHVIRRDTAHYSIVAETSHGWDVMRRTADARLIALAPELAVLCADMADALAEELDYRRCTLQSYPEEWKLLLARVVGLTQEPA